MRYICGHQNRSCGTCFYPKNVLYTSKNWSNGTRRNLTQFFQTHCNATNKNPVLLHKHNIYSQGETLIKRKESSQFSKVMFKNWQNKLWFDSSWVLGIWFSWVGRFWLKRPLLAHLSAANAAIAENISLSADSGIQPILNTISATVEWIPEANNFSQFTLLIWAHLSWKIQATCEFSRGADPKSLSSPNLIWADWFSQLCIHLICRSWPLPSDRCRKL